MTPHSHLTAAQSDPGGGKVMLDMEVAKALAQVVAAPEGDGNGAVAAVGAVGDGPGTRYCADLRTAVPAGSLMQISSEGSGAGPIGEALLAWCDDRQFSAVNGAELTAREEATTVILLEEFRAAIRSLPASQAQGEDKQSYADPVSSLQKAQETHAPVSAGVDLASLLREGCDLISAEVDALKAGISINGEVRADPEDSATLAAISEFEGWIARCAAALRTPPPASADGEGGEG